MIIKVMPDVKSNWFSVWETHWIKKSYRKISNLPHFSIIFIIIITAFKNWVEMWVWSSLCPMLLFSAASSRVLKVVVLFFFPAWLRYVVTLLSPPVPVQEMWHSSHEILCCLPLLSSAHPLGVPWHYFLVTMSHLPLSMPTRHTLYCASYC